VLSRLARLLLIAGVLVVPVGLVACGSDSKSSSDTERPGTSTGAESSDEEGQAGTEEYVIVPDSEVTAGLGELQRMGAAVVVAATAGNAKTAEVDSMYEKWGTFEGTIKQNEVELYLTLEDSLAGLRAAADKNDGPAAKTAMASFTEAADAYLAKHP
jgi:hypothetical protein